jgi:hypothetical protein
VERGKAETSYITQRSPAWCDRVLVRSNLPHKQASFVDYYSAPQVTTSDHKPVGAVLKVSHAGVPARPACWELSGPHQILGGLCVS